MSDGLQSNQSTQPIVTFVVIITLGVIVAVYINNDFNLRLPIILGSFIIGFIVLFFDLRRVVKISQSIKEDSKETKLSRDEKIVRYVANLFDEDISFDEIKNSEKNTKLDQ